MRGQICGRASRRWVRWVSTLNRVWPAYDQRKSSRRRCRRAICKSMDEGRAVQAIGGIGHAKAEAVAALLREMLPPYLLHIIDASFLRSHLLYDEFVYRLVLKVIREMGLGSTIPEGAGQEEIAPREQLEVGPAV